MFMQPIALRLMYVNSAKNYVHDWKRFDDAIL